MEMLIKFGVVTNKSHDEKVLESIGLYTHPSKAAYRYSITSNYFVNTKHLSIEDVKSRVLKMLKVKETLP